MGVKRCTIKLMKIYMMRHGQSQSNANKIVTGRQESPLTIIGEHQAKDAGDHLKDANIGLIICSPLERALATAKIIAKQIGYPASAIVVDSDLTERSLGELENKSYAKNPRMNGNFPETEMIKGIETLDHFHSRVSHGLRKIIAQAKNKNILIVGHINVGRMLWVITKGLKPIQMYDQPRLENAKVYELLDIS